jgi:hypothetical protein
MRNGIRRSDAANPALERYLSRADAAERLFVHGDLR